MITVLGSASKPDQTLHRREDHTVSDRMGTEGAERGDTEDARVNVAKDVRLEEQAEQAEDQLTDGAEEVQDPEDLQTGGAK